MFSAIGWLAALLTGFFTGLLSSFGLGGGTLLLLWLTFVTGIRAEVARGINLVYFLPVSAAALPAHARNGYLPGKALFWAIGAGMVAAGLSSWLSAGWELPWLDWLFGAYLLVMGVLELWKVWKGRKEPR